MDNKISTFIFDCFGVVSAPVLAAWCKDNKAKYTFTNEDVLEVFRKIDLDLLSEEDLIRYFLKCSKDPKVTFEMLAKEIDGYFKLDDTLIALIKDLKQKGFKTVLLSNANAPFFERKVYPTYPWFKELFDEIIISSSVGMVKPNKDIYLYTLKKINSRPEECLFIDDSKVNVDAALGLGMNGFVYTDVETFREHLLTLNKKG